eukprot:2829884-Pyramimonas_sp.AAC.1
MPSISLPTYRSHNRPRYGSHNRSRGRSHERSRDLSRNRSRRIDSTNVLTIDLAIVLTFDSTIDLSHSFFHSQCPALQGAAEGTGAPVLSGYDYPLLAAQVSDLFRRGRAVDS